MRRMISLLLTVAMLGCVAGCRQREQGQSVSTTPSQNNSADEAFGESLEALGTYDGYFDEQVAEVNVTCISGTPGCYTLQDNVLRFSGLQEDSVYALCGRLCGRIEIDVGDEYDFELELQGFSLVSTDGEPVRILSGDKVSIKAKSDYANYIYDMRPAIDENDETAHSGAIYSTVDLKLCGKGKLTVLSEHNNGIHTKDDLQVKNLTLLVVCVDNALKGNDSVELTDGVLTLIATEGDGIKTKNSDISSKGNQRGSVSISGTVLKIYAACDGIDAAYDVCIDEQSSVVNIYTDRYSSYSADISQGDAPSGMEQMPDMPNIGDMPDMPDMPGRGGFSGDGGGMVPPDGAQDIEPPQGTQPSDDAVALAGRPGGMGGMGGPGGPGGMGGFGGAGEGNTDKSDRSTKGIKADNTVTINAGTIDIRFYDDCIHANNTETLENGAQALGAVCITGGELILYSNDDAVHADGTLTISGGSIAVTGSYEGLEGTNVLISGGNVSVIASDDGINGVATEGTAIEISGGSVYVRCSGDGLDSNSLSSYTGIVFSGGNTLIICDSGGDSAIDTERGYTYTGGSVLAIMPARGMTSELTHGKNFSSIASKEMMTLTDGSCLSVKVGGERIVTVKMPQSLSAMVVYLGDQSAKFELDTNTTVQLDKNGVAWNIKTV